MKLWKAFIDKCQQNSLLSLIPFLHWIVEGSLENAIKISLWKVILTYIILEEQVLGVIIIVEVEAFHNIY